MAVKRRIELFYDFLHMFWSLLLACLEELASQTPLVLNLSIACSQCHHHSNGNWINWPHDWILEQCGSLNTCTRRFSVSLNNLFIQICIENMYFLRFSLRIHVMQLTCKIIINLCYWILLCSTKTSTRIAASTINMFLEPISTEKLCILLSKQRGHSRGLISRLTSSVSLTI